MSKPPPKQHVEVERIRCTAAGAGGLLFVAGTLKAFGIVAPWWVGYGKLEDDFWGRSYNERYDISPLTACYTEGPAPETCVQIASIVLFGFISLAAAFTAAVLCACLSWKFPRLVPLLFSSLLAAGSLGVGFFSLWLGMQLQSEGLGGAGFYSSLAALGFDAAATSLTVYGANKATPSAEALRTPDVVKESRLEKTRAAYQTAAQIARAMKSKRESRRSTRVSRAASGASVGVHGQSFIVLQQVLDWAATEDDPIPVDMLEVAFQEIDAEYKGSITQEQLHEALKTCGLDPAPGAMGLVMAEVDANGSGDIDIEEFVTFFQIVEELAEFGESMEARAQFMNLVCNICFCANLFGVSGVVLVMAQERDQESERFAFLRQLVEGLLLTFAVLFTCNVVIPMFRLTLGPNLAAWKEMLKLAIRERKERYLGKAMRKSQKIADGQARSARIKAYEESRTNSNKFHDPGALSSGQRRAIAWSKSETTEFSGDFARSPDPSPGGRSRSEADGSPSPISRGSSFVSPELEDAERENEQQEENPLGPGIYIVLHSGTAVRSGISIKSTFVRKLKRGDEVRIVEVFECRRYGRWRGKVEEVKEEGEMPLLGGWISLRDIEDDYAWAERTRGLVDEAAKDGSPNRAGSLSLQKIRSTVNLDKREVKQKRKSRRSTKASEAELSGTPAYDPWYYEEGIHRWEEWAGAATFNGLMQVQDPRTYVGRQVQNPEDQQIMGGLAANRGEWRLALGNT